GRDRALPVGDLLRALVHQQDDHVDVRVGGQDPAGDLLQHRGLPRLRRGHHHPALALPDGSDQVDDPLGDPARVVFEPEPFVGEQRGQLVELRPPPGGVGVDAVHGVDPQQCVVLLAVARLADGAGDLVPTAEREPTDLREGHVDVVGPGQVAAGPDEAVALGQDVEDALADGGGGDLLLARLHLALPALLALAPALLAGWPPVAGTIHHPHAALASLALTVGLAALALTVALASLAL